MEMQHNSDQNPNFFKFEEFDSPDEPGSGEKYISRELVEKLNKIRVDYGMQMRVNSGYRSEAHNAKVGGVKNSQHRKGTAADIHCPWPKLQDNLVKLALEHGIRGIGRYNTFVHLDVRELPEGDTRVRQWDNRTEK